MSKRIELTEGVQDIEGFVKGDKVIVQNAGRGAHFSTGVDPTTLEILQSIDGKARLVRLIGALPSDAGIILDQATAETAIGYAFVEVATD